MKIALGILVVAIAALCVWETILRARWRAMLARLDKLIAEAEPVAAEIAVSDARRAQIAEIDRCAEMLADIRGRLVHKVEEMPPAAAALLAHIETATAFAARYGKAGELLTILNTKLPCA